MEAYIENNVQDRNSEAWKRLCDYVEDLAISCKDEFAPIEVLGPDLFSEIFTLPSSISKLKNVTKIDLYGSSLKRIPPEIGEMKLLEYFDPYTSYSLHWFPYEITKCKHLKNSRISTRALLGNFKNRMVFPSLIDNPIRYHGDQLKCSICEKKISYDQTDQYWISIWVGTDTIPLLVNTCSQQCVGELPKTPKGFVKGPHKGGSNLIQPDEDRYMDFDEVIVSSEGIEEEVSEKRKKKQLGFLKLVRKIWGT